MADIIKDDGIVCDKRTLFTGWPIPFCCAHTFYPNHSWTVQIISSLHVLFWSTFKEFVVRFLSMPIDKIIEIFVTIKILFNDIVEKSG